MELPKKKEVLVSGASIAGLATAWWMNKIGYKVTVVEMAREPRVNGAAVDLHRSTVDIIKRMGLFEQMKQARLSVEKIVYKNADDITEGAIVLKGEGEEQADDNIEIEREAFTAILMNDLKQDIEFLFNNSVTALAETQTGVAVMFKTGGQRVFHLVLGCDGMHSGVRQLWFGHEKEYTHFLGAYFSITIVNKLLVKQGTMQMFNVPGKAIMLNAYNGKTDIIFCFLSEKEIGYNYRDVESQKQMVVDQFAGQGWRAEELLEEIKHLEKFYFDKFCQIKMPSWTKGRVALVGDAGYCASPAAGMGASLSVQGAAALADALQKHGDHFEAAFEEYNKNLRPFIEEVQATAEQNVHQHFILRTEEAIRQRNAQGTIF